MTGVVGNADKVSLPQALGADRVIDKQAEDLWTAAKRDAPGGYDVILDANGVPTLAASYRHLAPLGRLVVYGFHGMLPKSRAGSTGRPVWLKLARDWLRTPRFSPLALTRDNRSVMGFNLSFVSHRRERLVPAMQAILEGFAAGELQPPPLRRYPLAEAAAAQRDLESGATTGKLVLDV